MVQSMSETQTMLWYWSLWDSWSHLALWGKRRAKHWWFEKKHHARHKQSKGNVNWWAKLTNNRLARGKAVFWFLIFNASFVWRFTNVEFFFSFLLFNNQETSEIYCKYTQGEMWIRIRIRMSFIGQVCLHIRGICYSDKAPQCNRMTATGLDTDNNHSCSTKQTFYRFTYSYYYCI